MPRASDLEGIQKIKLFAYGTAGAGKTTLARQLPGKKFAFVFDPNTLTSYRNQDDIEFETFIPDEVSMALYSLKGQTDSDVNYKGSDKYREFETYYSENRERIVEEFDWLIADSITTLQWLEFDEIARLGHREGKFAELGDHNIVLDMILKNVRNFTALPMNVLIIGHEKVAQDKLTKTIDTGIMIPGQGGKKLPILFSDIYHLYVRREDDKIKYYADTVANEDFPIARCSLDLEPTIDITLPKNCTDPTQHGFGKLLRNNPRYNFSLK